jgi:endogenous inhibitor of DNA gyrase (YacG/DUF329 family)
MDQARWADERYRVAGPPAAVPEDKGDDDTQNDG